MKAQVLYGPKDIRYEEVKKPKCPNGGILIEMLACGICGSDLRTYEGGSKGSIFPAISGHEIVGKVIESEYEKFPVGTNLAIAPVIACGKCYYCKRGIQNQCDNLEMIGIAKGIDGGFAEYAAFDKHMLDNGCFVAIPKEFDPLLTVVSETASSVLSSQINADIGMEDLVVVIGSGTIGCLHSDIAKIRGAKEVMLVEMNEEKADIARSIGFDNVYTFLSSDKELEKIIMEKTDGRGADVIISACPSGQAQADAIQLVRKRGKIIFFGGINEKTATILDTNAIHYKEIYIFGASAYTPEVNKQAVSLILSARLDAKKYITKIYPLKDLETGYKEMKEGKLIKGIVIPDNKKGEIK